MDIQIDAKWVKRARKRIEKTNKEFGKASDRKKRILVAQDVIGLLALRSIKGQSGTYLDLSAPKDARMKIGPKTSMQKVFGDALALPSCSVCAIGAAMVSTIRLGNQVSLRDFVDFGGEVYGGDPLEAKKKVAVSSLGLNDWSADNAPWVKIFGVDRLSRMEDDFEHTCKCNKISCLHSSSLRLFAIMSNIIEHHGEYVRPEEFGFDTAGVRCFRDWSQQERKRELDKKHQVDKPEARQVLRSMFRFERRLQKELAAQTPTERTNEGR